MEGMNAMYYNYPQYPCPYYGNSMIYDPYYMYTYYPYSYWSTMPNHPVPCEPPKKLKDYGPNPFVTNIDKATEQNDYFRIALWTGKYFQLTLMSIPVCDDIGLEMHPDVDQFLRIEQGQGTVMMGDCKNQLDFKAQVSEDCIIIVPAGKWHNLINTGCIPLKLYSIYAPPEHPHGTIHRTKKEAEEEHSH